MRIHATSIYPFSDIAVQKARRSRRLMPRLKFLNRRSARIEAMALKETPIKAQKMPKRS